MVKLLTIILFFIGFVCDVQAQSSNNNVKGRPLRTFLGMFSLNLSTGYGSTFYKHKIAGPGLIQNPGGSLFIFDNTLSVLDTLSVGSNNWFNNPQSHLKIPVSDSSFIIGTDSIPIDFKSKGHSIPLNVSVHFKYDRYRLGIGFVFEPHIIGDFKPQQFTDNISNYSPSFFFTTYKKYYLFIGGDVFNTSIHTLSVDAKIGRLLLSNKFNNSLIQKRLYFNIGFRAEKALSEYLELFIRPSIEFKGYDLTMPESGYSINHKMPAFYVNLGVSLRMPDFRRCFLKSCRTQMNHLHGNREYRSRVHPMWKWQNPNYGQNDTKLIKYKRKNKRKLNPY